MDTAGKVTIPVSAASMHYIAPPPLYPPDLELSAMYTLRFGDGELPLTGKGKE